MVLTHAGAATQSLYVHRLLTPSPTPPTVVVLKANQLSAADYAGVYGGNGSWAKDQIYNGLVDSTVARLPADNTIISIDPNAHGWNYSTMVASGDAQLLHPNDLGQACYADMISSALNSLTARNGLLVL